MRVERRPRLRARTQRRREGSGEQPELVWVWSRREVPPRRGLRGGGPWPMAGTVLGQGREPRAWALTTRDLGPSQGIDPEHGAERAVGGGGGGGERGRGLTARLAGGVHPRGNPESSAQLPLGLRGAQGGGTQVKQGRRDDGEVSGGPAPFFEPQSLHLRNRLILLA